MNDRVCVFIVSCDKYSDLWNPFFTLFFRYWPDCPYPVYLASNHKTYDHPKVIGLKTGDDVSWSFNTREALKQLEEPCCILFQEDFLLQRSVDTKRVDFLSEYMTNHEAACLRLYPSPPPDCPFDEDQKIGLLSKGSAYRVSLQTAIWDVAVLINLLNVDESPWELESAGSVRSNALEKPFLSIMNGSGPLPIDYFSTAVCQGLWVRPAIELCRKEQVAVDLKWRAVETRLNEFKRVQVMSRIYRLKRFLATC